jgi:hypothetical protein
MRAPDDGKGFDRGGSLGCSGAVVKQLDYALKWRK